MLKKLTFLMSLVLVLALAGNASAGVKWWWNADPVALWTDGNMYLVGSPPTAEDQYKHQTDWSHCVIDGTIAAVANQVHVNWSREAQCYLDITGGSLTVSGAGAVPSMDLGHIGPGMGVVNQTAGDVDILAGDLAVGHWGCGRYFMQGGTLDIAGQLQVNLYGEETYRWGLLAAEGGTITVGGGIYIGDAGLINITAGTLVFQDDMMETVKTVIDGYVTAGKITGYGKGGTVNVVWTPMNGGTTTVTAVPEPMTIALLGLGGLFLRRRR